MQENKAADRVVWRQTTWEPGKQNMKPDISTVVLAMIREFVGTDQEIDTDFLWDDRMFVHTCLAFSGQHPKHPVAEETYHALFTLATYVDQSRWDYLGGYAYDREFVRKQFEPLTYRRWYEVSGNLYGFTRFSAVFFGFDGFFHKIVTRHIFTMYLRMSVIALFYRSSLLHYGYRVVHIKQPDSPNAKDKAIDGYRRELQSVQWELTRFTNRYWFSELSAQDQGIELFNLQTAALDLQKQYNRVKNDIEQAHQALETKASFALSKLSFWVGIYALWFSIVFLIAGFFGIDMAAPIDIPGKGNPVVSWVVVYLVVAAIVGAIILIIKMGLRIWRR